MEKQRKTALSGIDSRACRCIYLLCRTVYIDYGFAGVLLPLYAEAGRLLWERVFAGIPPVIGERLGFAIGLLALAGVMGGLQRFCVLAIFPILLLGNERGKMEDESTFSIFTIPPIWRSSARCRWRLKQWQDK